MKLPVQLTGGEDHTSIAGSRPTTASSSCRATSAAQENPGLYLLDPERRRRSSSIQHTPKVQTVARSSSPTTRSRSTSRANDIKPDSYAIYRYDVKAGKRELVFDTPGLWGVADHRGDTVAARQEPRQHAARGLPVRPQDARSSRRCSARTRSRSTTVAVRREAGPGARAARTSSATSSGCTRSRRGKLTPISPDVKHDVAELRDRRGAQAHLLHDQRGRLHEAARARREDAQAARAAEAATTPTHVSVGGVIAQRSVRAARRRAARSCRRRAVVYDWQTKKVDDVARARDARGRRRRSSRSATLETTRRATAPRSRCSCAARRSARRTPARSSSQFHGGPEGQSRPGFSPVGAAVRRRGLRVRRAQRARLDGYGKAWLHADDGPKRLAGHHRHRGRREVHHAARGRKNGKAPKVGVIGGSYGGYSTLMAMTILRAARTTRASRTSASRTCTRSS